MLEEKTKGWEAWILCTFLSMYITSANAPLPFSSEHNQDAFCFLSYFSSWKMSLTFLKGFNLLLGKGCPISLQLSFQLKSHLCLI